MAGMGICGNDSHAKHNFAHASGGMQAPYSGNRKHNLRGEHPDGAEPPAALEVAKLRIGKVFLFFAKIVRQLHYMATRSSAGLEQDN